MNDKKPNILIIWGDDIGWWNISYNSRGQMGFHTPNIDRIGNEGVAFTDYYAQQSCTAGRAAFITGQNPIRTGLTKVGMPGADLGLQAEDPTIAELLKPLGYATGQFGKNHLGDKDEFLPSNHGFDEFFGNLYHLNAEEEPELPDYPKDPEFRKKFGPRGVIHGFADGRIEDTGPLTKKRMETIDDEATEHTLRFIDDAHKAGKPFFVWWNSTAMHFRTHCAKEHEGKSGQGFYNDVMVAHDERVGVLLKKLDDLGIADNTIVMYSTDNGPHYNSWPDAGITPFRSEKNTNWEGGWRVPAFVRWPGKIPAGKVLNGIVCHQDWLPTLLAAVGESDIKEKLLKGHKAGDKTYKVKAEKDGRVLWIKNSAIVLISREAGAPRDKGAGIHLRFKMGDKIKKGDTLFTIHSNNYIRLSESTRLAEQLKPIVVGKKFEEKMLLERIYAEIPKSKIFMLER